MKTLNYQELLEYVKNNGITLARMTEDLGDIPKGTKLWFRIDGGSYLSTYDKDVDDKNGEFRYDFDYEWSSCWKSDYKGSFELVDNNCSGLIQQAQEQSEQYKKDRESINNKLINTPNLPRESKGKKIMSIVTNAFKSRENKALEYFTLGTTEQLNEAGRREFTDYIYETGDTTKKGFLAKIVEAYKEAKK